MALRFNAGFGIPSTTAIDEDWEQGARRSFLAANDLKRHYLDATESLDGEDHRLRFGFSIGVGGMDYLMPAMSDGDDEWYNLVMDFFDDLRHYYERKQMEANI
jgi:hypothetical protein